MFQEGGRIKKGGFFSLQATAKAMGEDLSGISPTQYSDKESFLDHLRCRRCDALMRRERIIFGGQIFTSWICALCGEVVDKVILENRILQAKAKGIPIPSTPYIDLPKW